MDPEEGGYISPFSKFYFEFFLWWSENEVSIPSGLVFTGRVQRFGNLDNTGTVLGDLCTLALLPSCVKYTLTR